MIEPNWIWGLAEIALLSVLCMTGMHIFIVIGLLGAIFTIIYYGDMSGIVLIGSSSFARASDYAMSMVPLFILMGVLVEKAGMGKDAYDACMKWMAKVKGSLAIVSLGAIGIFSAISGSALASVATIGGIALPEMRRYNYSAALRTGAIASGAMVDALIPPSTVAVFYAILTDESIGKLFIAGIIPGIILIVLFVIVIYIWVTLRPGDAPMLPQDVRFTWGDRFRSISLITPIFLIFFIIIGGIYFAWFSPTEAAGIGAFTVLLVCLAYRRMSWRNFNDALASTVRTSGMILIIIMAAYVYSNTLAMTHIAAAIGDLITSAELSYIPLMYIIAFIYLIIGLPLSGFTLLVFTIPIFYPVITTIQGAPPMAGIWFGVIVIVLVELAAVTPPMANLLFLTQLIDGCRSKDVIIGVIPFYAGTCVLLVMLIHLPFLATWLPSKMLGGG